MTATTREQCLRKAAELAPAGRQWAEFGVGRGGSARLLHALAGLRSDAPHLYLFDSFRGLPEPWKRGMKPNETTAAGTWDRGGAPPPDLEKLEGATIIVGSFADTVPRWVSEFATRGEPLGLIHIDCDLYSSTRTVLDAVGALIQPGTLVLFDEFQGYPLAAEHEAKAWAETVETLGLDASILARGDQQALFRVDSVGLQF